MKRNRKLIEAEGAPAQILMTGSATIQAAEKDKAGPRRFEMDAYFGGVLAVGFAHPVVVDLATLKGTDKPKPALKDHDKKVVIGHTESIANDGRALKASGVFSGAGSAAKEVIEAADNGFPWSCSIGASPGKLEMIAAGRKVTVNSQTFEGPLLVARGATLKEISFVSIGADDQASARLAAHGAEGVSMNFEQWLEAMGFSLADLTDQQKTQLQAKYDAEIKASADDDDDPKPAKKGKKAKKPALITASADDDPEPDPVLDIRARFADESKRIDAIHKACGGKHPDIQAKAIEEGWDVTKTELEVLRASRPSSPAGFVKDKTLTSKVIEASFAVSGNLPDVEKKYDDATLQAAHTRFPNGVGLQEALLEAAWANGYTGRSVKQDLRGVLEHAFIKASGFSTISLPGILSNTANSFLLSGFMGVESVWREIADIGSVSDFKAITSYRLTGGMEYEEVGADGQIKHGSIGEESFTNRARTYAKMFGITRQDIINDDLNALTGVPKLLGRGAGLKLNKVFWTEFLNNASFFSSGNKNLVTTTSLNIAGLTAAELKYLNQTDPDGNPLAVAPDTLLVPPAHLVTATSLMQATEIRDTTASTKYTTNNPHAGKFRVLSSVYLSNSTISGNSATTWYLLSRMFPVMQVLFLNGRQQPTVETADADFNSLGVQMRGYHDFGVAKQDSRGGVKVTA